LENSYSNDNDPLNKQDILPYLCHDITDRIFIYNSLESTNITAKELAAKGAKHGTVLIADSQTAGKGRYGRSFFSPPGHGLYMSFILQPEFFGYENTTLITAFAAVAVCEAIEAITDTPVAGKSIKSKTPQIKWVNDVFINGKKVCGILTESVISSDSSVIPWIVLGIGVNFKTPKAGFPEDLQKIAGCIFENEKPTVSRNRLAAEIINRLVFPVTNQVSRNDKTCCFEKAALEKTMLENYKQRMFLLGKPIIVTGVGDSFEAIATDIDDLGQLIVKKDNGELLTLNSGEVCIRNK